MLSVRDLYKSYWDGERRVEVLKGVSLDVEEGEFVGIFGPSGSGKTTLLHIMLGIESPDRGEVLLDGRRTTPDDTGRLISIVFQDPLLLKDLTVEENVMLPMVIKGVPEEEAREVSRSLLSKLGMSHRLSHLPHQLSGGERQRVSICRALVPRPRVLLLDEPSGNLDREMEMEVMDLIWSLKNDGVSVVMVTHNLELLKGFDRVFKLDGGVLKEA